MRKNLSILAVAAIMCLAGLAATASAGLRPGAAGLRPGEAGTIQYVIHISVDGLRPDAITNLGQTGAPNFYRMRTQGAFTDNARTDYDYTITLPSHATQLTSWPVSGAAGHHWTGNGDPSPGQTLATGQGSYVAGVYDVAHDSGLRTGLYASKTKFSLFRDSWNATHGAADATGPDNGKNKIDTYVNNNNTVTLVNILVADMKAAPFNYVFLHLTDPDTTGHAKGWDPRVGSAYSQTIRAMDSRLGSLFDMIDKTPVLKGKTAIILTADHGGGLAGVEKDHSDPSRLNDYRVPFYVWGPGVKAGADLYALNAKTRKNPGDGRPPITDAIQPIRNGEAGNLALQWLGLGPIPGSTFNAAQNLEVGRPKVLAPAAHTPATTLAPAALGGAGLMLLRRRRAA
jgi:hypothetical protein